MQREANIPLFLWIATAVVAHGIWGGGVNHASRLIGETLEIRDFAASVRKHAQGKAKPIEVALLDESEEPEQDEPDPEAEPEEPEEAEPEVDETSKEDDPTDKTTKPDPLAKDDPKELEQKEKEEEKEKEKEKEKEEEKPKNELVIEKVPLPERQKRIAVQQHVDPNQQDNPDAEFIADQANKVKEQTQARITSTDQNDPNPNPGSSLGGPAEEPGNGELDRVAQSEDRDGDPDRAPQETASRAMAAKPAESKGPDEPRPAEANGVERRQDGAVKGSEKSASNAPGQQGQRAQQASRAQEAMPETMSTESGGGFSIDEKREASIQQSARRAKKKRELPKQRSGKPGDLLGLGAPGSTPGGVNLNLAPRVAVAAIGEDKLWRERQADGQRRRSAHRGSWKTGGIERWRSAIENYVPSVKPGNQTALNSARVPFAGYLNMVHNRLHPIFADGFLASLSELPSSHPMNDQNLVTHLEIVLDKDEGRVVRLGVTKSSGVTAFDVSALSSVDRAQPFGAPPREIVSPDGNVYFHWEFYRLPQYACSTYYAHPYILKAAPKPAPAPSPAPEAPPSEDYKPPPAGERHGYDYRDPHGHDGDHDHEG